MEVMGRRKASITIRKVGSATSDEDQCAPTRSTLRRIETRMPLYLTISDLFGVRSHVKEKPRPCHLSTIVTLAPETLHTRRHRNTIVHLPIRHGLVEQRLSAAQDIDRMPDCEMEWPNPGG